MPVSLDRRRRARRVLLAAAGAVLVLAAAGWVLSRDDGGRTPRAATSAGLVPVSVERRDLLSSQSVPGKLGYADPRTMASPLAGVVTALPSEGAVVAAGRVLLRVDGQPVVLLSGGVPMYRTLSVGSRGPDVLELERNLHRLRYDAERPLTVDDRYTGATAQAVRRLQRHLGVTQTGVLGPSEAVFAAGPRRVGTIRVSLGARVAPGTPLMQTTSVRRLVSLTIDAADRATVHRGQRVTVTLPSGAPRGGRIATVGRVAREQAQGQSTRTVVDVTVRLASRHGLAGLDEAPVSVALTSTAARDVLVVPVTALRARPGRGYAVLVPGGGARTRLVSVVPGRFAGGYVAISGPGLRAGMKVLVPSDTI